MYKKTKLFSLFLTILLVLTPSSTYAKASIIKPENNMVTDTYESDIAKMYKTIEKYSTTWERDSTTGKYTYPVNSSSDIWNLLNHAEKVALCNIPDYVISDMTDEELVELTLDYPLLGDIYAYDTFYGGIEALSEYIPAFNKIINENMLNEYLEENSSDQSVLSANCTNQTVDSIHDSIKSMFINDYIEQNNISPYLSIQEYSTASSYIYTPNYSPVYYVQYGEQLSSQDKQNYRNYVYQNYSNCSILAEATTNYNCHSYAWYITSFNTSRYPDPLTVWIPDPSPFMSDGSYTYVGSNPTANGQKVYYPYSGNEHSGVVTNYSTKEITSKWGPGPLVRHNVYNCPYFVIPMVDQIVYYRR